MSRQNVDYIHRRLDRVPDRGRFENLSDEQLDKRIYELEEMMGFPYCAHCVECQEKGKRNDS